MVYDTAELAEDRGGCLAHLGIRAGQVLRVVGGSKPDVGQADSTAQGGPHKARGLERPTELGTRRLRNQGQ